MKQEEKKEFDQLKEFEIEENQQVEQLDFDEENQNNEEEEKESNYSWVLYIVGLIVFNILSYIFEWSFWLY